MNCKNCTCGDEIRLTKVDLEDIFNMWREDVLEGCWGENGIIDDICESDFAFKLTNSFVQYYKELKGE